MYSTLKQYDDRTRFNWGFHDGAYDQRLGKSCKIQHSDDKVYLKGYQMGFEVSSNGKYDHKVGDNVAISNAAWEQSGLNKPPLNSFASQVEELENTLKQKSPTLEVIEKDLEQLLLTQYGVFVPKKTIQSVATSVFLRIQRKNFIQETIKTAKGYGFDFATLSTQLEQQWSHINRDNKNRPDYDNN